MKLSINWVRSINSAYNCSADPMPNGIDDLIEKIGTQLGAVDEVIDLSKKYEGILIVKVEALSKHPKADKLSICLISDGKKTEKIERNKDGLIQIICGASNVKAGQLVVWIPPGITIPSSFGKDPLVIESREIRGVISHGMIASAKELDLSDDHHGILVIDQPVKSGETFANAYKLNDYIVDIENKMFTHRPDLFGQLGLARELAGIQQIKFHSPKWYLEPKTINNHKSDDKLLSVKNEAYKFVPRFAMQIVKNVKINNSSVTVQSTLSRIGIRPINNIVDSTNYIMHETAQPIHAYDYDKVKSLSSRGKAKIVVRQAKKGEALLLLNGKTVKLKGEEIVIATDKQIIGLAGVMGGKSTEVDRSTKNIILEVGTFDATLIRLTAMNHGLFTEAATRFTKNQSPWQNNKILARAVNFIASQVGGMPARGIYDLKRELNSPTKLETTASFINARLGFKLSAVEIAKILRNVEFKVETKGEGIQLQTPFWRTDIKIQEDIVEEVGRLYGYKHLPPVLPLRKNEAIDVSSALKVKQRVTDLLYKAGGNEVLTYSFVNDGLLKSVGQDENSAFKLRNAISPELKYYRLSLTPSLLQKIHPNIKQGFDEFILFEVGKSHHKDEIDSQKLPHELERVGAVFASKDKKFTTAYYHLKKVLEYLAKELGQVPLSFKEFSTRNLSQGWLEASRPFEPKKSALIFADKEFLGLIGEPKQDVQKKLKLPLKTALFELDMLQLQKFSNQNKHYRPLNTYPSVNQDLCLKVNAGLAYAEITEFINVQLNKISREKKYEHSIQVLDIFQRQNDTKHKQITWRILLTHPDKTLTAQEVNSLLQKLADLAKTKYNAVRI